MNDVIEVRQLTKFYGQVMAVNQVSFTIEEGKIYGLLGRNGAGKTTIMRIIAAQEFVTSGKVKVFGETPYENSRVLSQLCLVKDTQKYPNNYRIADVLEQAAWSFPSWDRAYAMALAQIFQLPLNRRMKALSRGMLSAAGVVVGLASRAPVTIFDEPYLGLDAVARDLFYNQLLEDYTEHPRTIMLSTHLIDEVSRLLEHILVVDQGRLILDEEAETLRGRAFAVVGPSAKVDAYIADREVLHRESVGGLVSATVMSKENVTEHKQVEALGLEIVPVSLQQLIVHLTSNKATEYARKAVETL